MPAKASHRNGVDMGFFFKSKGNNLSTLASVAQSATSIGLHYEPALEEADAEYAQSGPDRKNTIRVVITVITAARYGYTPKMVSP